MADSNLILIVDDNETARYGKVRTLRRAGFEVLEAATGTDALRLVAEHMPRLVVLDVNMPDISGWEVCRRLKSDPETASVLVLQVSATYVREEDTVRALDGGADACLTAPIEGTVLIATVRALLRARRAEDALRAALEREQAANRTKDEFLAMLSHELRSPIGAILTWVTLLRSGRVDGRRTAHGLEAIERNTRLQVKLIEDLLDVSRIISGKMRLEMGPVDLGAVVEAALEPVRSVAEAKGIVLQATTDPAAGQVSGDFTRLQQVVWNLLSNAVKFTPQGGRVEVRVDLAESRARIQVADTGRGIDKAFLPHIFERFRQADSSSTRSEGGLGLGLAIVRHLVELHGGTVEADSDGPGHGAIFTVRLPLPAVRAEIARSERPRPATSFGEPVSLRTLGGTRVLVLDNERDAREAIAAVLEECGAHVVAARSAREALAVLDEGGIDVVVSDLAMPDEDGYAFIRAVRERPAGAVRIPVIALTAYGGLEDQRRVREAGFDGYLAKPVDAVALVNAVGHLAES